MRMRCTTYFAVLALALNACSSGARVPEIEVQDPWARAVTGMGEQSQPGESSSGETVLMGMNGAAYMVLRNNGGAPDRLLRVESEVAEAVELHIVEMKDDVMSMHPVEFIEVPARGQVELKPGGLHVMLIGLKGELKPGENLTLLLLFERSDEMTVDALVRAP